MVCGCRLPISTFKDHSPGARFEAYRGALVKAMTKTPRGRNIDFKEPPECTYRRHIIRDISFAPMPTQSSARSRGPTRHGKWPCHITRNEDLCFLQRTADLAFLGIWRSVGVVDIIMIVPRRISMDADLFSTARRCKMTRLMKGTTTKVLYFAGASPSRQNSVGLAPGGGPECA